MLETISWSFNTIVIKAENAVPPSEVLLRTHRNAFSDDQRDTSELSYNLGPQLYIGDLHLLRKVISIVLFVPVIDNLYFTPRKTNYCIPDIVKLPCTSLFSGVSWYTFWCLEFQTAIKIISSLKTSLRKKGSARTSWGEGTITVAHLDNRIKDQESHTDSPTPSHFGRQRFSELALAPFRDNQEFSYNCREEEPDMLAHSHGAPWEWEK